MDKDVRKKYDQSFPSHKKFWKRLCSSHDEIGWKSMYFMILDFQKNVAKETSYILKKTV